MWAALAAALTARAARTHLPFGLTWWSFTFPIGTCVTGTSALAAQTGAMAFRWAAIAGYATLVAAWAVVGARTAAGAWRGRLFLPNAPVAVPQITTGRNERVRVPETAGELLVRHRPRDGAPRRVDEPVRPGRELADGGILDFGRASSRRACPGDSALAQAGGDRRRHRMLERMPALLDPPPWEATAGRASVG